MKALVPFLALVSFAVAAATPEVTTKADPSTNFSSYKTYYWIVQPDDASVEMHQHLVEGIDARLKAKGWTLAANGDVGIAVNVSTSKTYRPDARGGVGFSGSTGGSDTMTMRQLEVSTVVVDMFDAKAQRAIWSGISTGPLPRASDKAGAEIDKGLDKMFASFPPSPKA
ncbi:MAG: DUF4136 domain-containing protein [Luteibacter sp.]|nr:DUF4136 domain-containing protein [Luteibacter sp.]